MSAMFVCNVCEENFSSSNLLIAHIRLFHADAASSPKALLCRHLGCSRKFDRIRSFTRHLQSHSGTSSCVSNVDNCAVVNVTNKLSVSDVAGIECIDRESVSPVIDLADSVQFSQDDFQQAVTNGALGFLGKLYNDNTLTRSHIQLVVDSQMEVFSTGLMKILETKVLNLLDKTCDVEGTTEVKQMFQSFENMYLGLETEYKRLRTFQECGAFIKPEPFVIGPSVDEKHSYGRVIVEPFDLTGQFIPMRKVLKAFLELPGSLHKILTYIEKLENSDGSLLENIIQGSLWQKKIKPLFPGKLVLPVNLYYDGFDACDAGSHGGVHEIGGVYFQIPCLPDEDLGSLENIFTAGLFYAHDKCVGNADAFRLVLNELKFLEEEGITVVLADKEVQVYFALCLFLGDNLGVHSVLGYAESFNANYYCRKCKVHRDVARKQTQADLQLIRTSAMYEEDLAAQNISISGIKERCIFDSLRSFKVVENVCFDKMHDTDEGTWDYDMVNIIQYFLKNKRFTLEELNHRVQGFDYGPSEAGNKPPIILADHLKARKLHFSATERLCFVRYFGLMVGDLVTPCDVAVWHFYEIISDIVDVLSAPFVNVAGRDLFSNLISEHHKLFLELFPDNQLRPKAHFMLHYPDIMLEVGPLSKVCCLRFEAYHRHYKQAANASCNHVNLPHTLALKNQLKLCYRLLSSKGLDSKVIMSPGEVHPLQQIDDYVKFAHILPSHVETLHVLRWVDLSGTLYKIGMVLVVKLNSDYPVFGQIKVISFDERGQAISFVLNNFVTVLWSAHFHAFEVVQSDDYLYLQQKDLIAYMPTHVRLAPNGHKYVTFRHVL